MESIRAYLASHIRLFRENLKFVRLYLAETRGAGFNIRAGLDGELKEKYEQVMTKLADVFKSVIKKRLFKKFDPYLLATALDGMTHALLFQDLDHADEHPFDTDMIMKMFFESILENPETGGGSASS